MDELGLFFEGYAAGILTCLSLVMAVSVVIWARGGK